jgi:uncharacterized repeat protein (TIGR01451 family)
LTFLALVSLVGALSAMPVAAGAKGSSRAPQLDVRARHRHSPTLTHPIRHPSEPSEPESLVNDPAADTTNQDTQSETAIALSGSNISTVFNDSGSCLPNCYFTANQFTGYSVSSDGGATFTDEGTLPSSLLGDGGDPSLAADQTSGTLYLATLDFNATQIQVFTSTDGGVSWSAPANGSPGSSSVDKPWIVVDDFPGPGQGTIYLAYANYPASGGIQIMVTTSMDGITWSAPTPVTPADPDLWHWGPYQTVAPDHSVHVFWLDIPLTGTPNDSIQTASSSNGGVSFGPPTTVTVLSTSGFAGDLGLGGFRSNSLGHPAANPVSGDLYVVYNEVGVGTDRADIYLQQSADGGLNWDPPVPVNDDGGTNDQFGPDVTVTPDGTRIFVGFYDRRLDPANNLIDWFGAAGAISGPTITFGPNFRISTESFPPAFGQDPVVNSAYMGDYDSVVSDNSLVYTLWGDNRDGDAFFASQPDVRFAKLPARGVDLALAKSDSPDPVNVGEDLTYSITVEQLGGPDLPTGVRVTDPLPAGTVFESATASQGSCSESGGTVICELGTLSTGSATVQVIVSPIAPGTLSNSATVVADQADLDLSNNTDTEETVVLGQACGIVGTPGDDVLSGTNGDDIICGLGGNDTITGLNGDDVLLGGAGTDILRGGNGEDQLDGQSGDDQAFGENGKDVVVGGSGADQLNGGTGKDSLDALDGVGANDSVDGDLGVDACQGDPGDVLVSCP